MRRNALSNGGNKALKFQKIGETKIKGKDWEFGWGDAGTTKKVKDDACCSYYRRKIIVNPTHTRTLLEIIPHEVAHAFFPRAKEGTILAFGACVEELLKAYLDSSE